MDRRYAVLALGFCLLAGVVPGCICHWTPPEKPFEVATSDGLGASVVFPLTTMWPGETRRIPLPDISARITIPSQFVMRGKGFTIAAAPASALRPALAGSIIPGHSAAPAECWLHLDSLATAGDTLEVRCTVLSFNNPRRHSRWIWPVVVSGPRRVATAPRVIADARIIKGVPPETTLEAFPNPFNPATTLVCRLARPGGATLRIYDARGQLVITLGERESGPGVYRLAWDGHDSAGHRLRSGVYFARLVSRDRTATCKLVILK